MPDCVEPSWSIRGAFGTTPLVKDPVQGPVLKNCSLIAAFASLAWKARIGVQTGSPYTFKFYRTDQNNNVIGDSQKADGILPADSTGKLMHARSDDPSKYWPALYEKAYYMWLDKVGLDKSDGRPNYCNYTQGQNAITVLFQLTGYKVENIIKKTSLTDANTVFKDIDLWCTGFARSSTNRIINTPAVAWTRDTGTQYSDTTIIKEHTYSVLGVTGKKDATGQWTEKYIVLRNPFGSIGKDPGLSLYTPSATWCSTYINLADLNDGIFAISAADFFTYFVGFAWTPG